MNVTFGIMEGISERIRNKQQRYEKIANRALEIVDAMAPELEG